MDNENTDLAVNSRSILGSFATKEFWIDLARLIIRETAYAFISHLGSSLVHYAQLKAGPDSKRIRILATGEQVPGQVPGMSTAPIDSQNSQHYRPQYTNQPGQAPTYPGFGQR